MSSRTFNELIHAAANLVSEDGENPEYDRALCELIAELGVLPRTAYADGMTTAVPYVRNLIEIKREAQAAKREVKSALSLAADEANERTDQDPGTGPLIWHGHFLDSLHEQGFDVVKRQDH